MNTITENLYSSLIAFFHLFKKSEDQDYHGLSYTELMGISWGLHLLQAFYSVFAIFLGIKSYEYFSSSRDFTHLVLDSFNFKLQKMGLISVLFTVVLYPLIFHASYRAWKSVLKFYAKVFEYEPADLDQRSDDIMHSAFSANLFLVFPILGNVLSNIAMAYFVFRGLKQKYEFTSLQATLVLFTPLFIVFLFAIFSASYFIFLFSLL